METPLPSGLKGCLPCKPVCECVFDRVCVSYLTRGGTRVMWELLSSFAGAMPYVFQLQVGETKNQDADDWKDVGVPVTNIFCAVDGEQRIFGKTKFQFYRVRLLDGDGNTHYSEPVGLEGTLSRRDWRIGREIIRSEMVRMRIHAGQRGYLLKQRIAGDPCTECIDHLTNEVRDPNCPVCYGTGFRCGYFFPIACVWADIDPRTYRIELDGGQNRGTINDVAVKARMFNTWMLSEGDIWVNATTDDRYYIHRVQNVAEMRGVPLIANVEMRPAPATDVAFDIEIPQQIDELLELC